MLLAVCASVAVAAAPWSPPQTLSSPSLFVDNPDVVVVGATAARSRPGSGAGRKPADGEGARRDAAGGARAGRRAVRPRARAPEVCHPPDPVQPRPRGRAATPAGAGAAASRCAARFGNSQGEFGPPRTRSRPSATPASRPRSAGPDGSLAAWIAKSSHGRRIVRAALKSRGRFRHPFTLRGRGRANDVVAGPGARRDVRGVGARGSRGGAGQAFVADQVERRSAPRAGQGVRDDRSR